MNTNLVILTLPDGTTLLWASHEQRSPKASKGTTAEHPGWEEFWAAFPSKKGKAAAHKKWNQLRPDEALRARIMQAIKAQSQWEQWQKGVIPNPATWLNQKRWEDEDGRAGSGLGQPGRVRARPGKYDGLAQGVAGVSPAPAADSQPGLFPPQGAVDPVDSPGDP